MLKKIFEISCRRATFLASKKEAGKTSFFENIKLKLHYKICDGCSLFEKQTTVICKNAKHSHKHADVEMRQQKKTEIKEILDTIKIVFTAIAGRCIKAVFLLKVVLITIYFWISIRVNDEII